jgi:PAS domain S-box-containing protein
LPSHAKISTALDLLESGGALFDSDFHLVHANRNFLALRDYPAELCRPGARLEDLLRFNAERGDYGEGDAHSQVEQRLTEIAGSSVRVIERKMADNRILRIRYCRAPGRELLVTIEDRTEEYRAQAALAASEERHALVTRAASDGIYDWNVADDLLFVSDRLGEMLGIDIGLNGSSAWMDRIHEKDREGYVAALRAHFRGNADGINCAYRVRNVLGEWRWLRDRGLGVRGMDGRVKRLVGAVSDVTEVVEADRAAELARRRFLEAIEAISSGFVLWDAEDQLVQCNSRYRQYFSQIADMVEPGLPFERLMRAAVERGLFPGREADADAFLATVLERRGRCSSEPREQHLKGDVWLLITDHRTADGGIVSIYTDVSQIKQAERDLREREVALNSALEEFDAVLENIDHGVLFMGADLHARIVNQAFREMWGIPQDLIDRKPHMRQIIDWNRGTGLYDVPEEEFDAWREERIAAIAAGPIPPREFKRGDGRVLSYRGVVLADGGRMLTYFDITELKDKEAAILIAKEAADAALVTLREAQARLVHSEKMASLGQLTAGIAHEIKNPLNFVNNFAKLSAEMTEELADLLRDPIAALGDDDRAEAEDLLGTIRANLLKIDEHGRRADSIVRNMLQHSRDGVGETRRVDINAIALEAMNLAYHGARAADPSFNAELDSELAADLAEVEGQPQELQRVFLNLCSNGLYAASRRTSADGAPPRLRLYSRALDGIMEIEVEDNGDGVPAEVQDRIFQPFFTTKPTGDGTGLGLSMSYDIVRRHHGEIELFSEPGRGAIFRVSLPAAAPARIVT